MNDFLLVFKTIYKNSHAKQIGIDGKKKRSSLLTFVISMVPLILILCFGLYFISYNIHDIKVFSGLMGMIVLVAQVSVLFLSISLILNTMYSSRDISILNSLPLKQNSIFFAKLSICYLDMLSLITIILLPGLLTLSISYNISNGTIFYGIYPFIILICLTAPILPLFLVILFSMPLNFISSYFKGKSNVKSIFSLIIYLLLIILYLFFIYYINSNNFFGDNGVELSNSTYSSFINISKIMYPNYVLIAFSLGIDFGKNFGIYIGLTLAIIAILLILSSLFYKKINQKNLDCYSKSNIKQDLSYKQNNIISTLVIRDFKLIFRNQYITLTSFANLILSPLMLVLYYFINNGNGAETQMSEVMFEMMNVGFVVMFSMIFISGTNMVAALAYTREGETFYITRHLPIDAKDSILSKIIVSVIPAFIIIIANSLIGIFLYKINILSILILIVSLVLSTIGSSCLHVYYDMKKGNIHWKTNQDLKQVSGANTGTLIAVFASMIPGLLLFGLTFILSIYIESINIIKIIYWVFFFIICLIIFIIGFITLYKKGIPLFYKIGDKRYVIKDKKNTYKLK